MFKVLYNTMHPSSTIRIQRATGNIIDTATADLLIKFISYCEQSNILILSDAVSTVSQEPQCARFSRVFTCSPIV